MKKRNLFLSAVINSRFMNSNWGSIPQYIPTNPFIGWIPFIDDSNADQKKNQAQPETAINPFSWKTLLFLPQFAFAKAQQTGADCFIVDFQDAVPLPMKAAVREGLKTALLNGVFGQTPVVVRINENAIADEQQLDLDTVVGLNGVTALMPTMIEKPEELDALHQALLIRERKGGIKEGSTKLLPLIETPGAVLRADAIAQSGGGRLIGLFLGHGDLFRLSGATPHTSTTMDFPRNAVLLAARAAGIPAFDTPYTKVSDSIGLEREAREAKKHGFDGKACIHCNQISIVKRCMQPTGEELTWASKVEKARKNGLLDTLQKKLNDPTNDPKEKRQTDGMALVDGQLVGPPHIKASQRILSLTKQPASVEKGRTGRVVHHHSDAAIAPGAVIENPYELTITEGMLDLWLQSFYTHDPALTSRHFASSMGACNHPNMPVPFMMALYLCVSMSDTHGAIYHLGFRDAKQTGLIQTGDTVRQKITVLRVRNTGDGKRAVVTTLRELINTQTNDVVFRTEKTELYPAQPHDFGMQDDVDSLRIMTPADDRFHHCLQGWVKAQQERMDWTGFSSDSLSVETGEILLHSFARPLGITANLSLSTRFLVTHPIHLDHRRFDQGDGLGIVVSGGLVISLILAAAARDFSHIIWEELIAANNIKPVSPNETVGAFSVVINREDVPGYSQLEWLTIKTIGVKNRTPAIDLIDQLFPEDFLKPLVGGGSRYDALCTKHNLPILEGQIVGEVLRRVVRMKPYSD
jgi:citrate lyase beta subunit/acyl dehydratase